MLRHWLRTLSFADKEDITHVIGESFGKIISARRHTSHGWKCTWHHSNWFNYWRLSRRRFLHVWFRRRRVRFWSWHFWCDWDNITLFRFVRGMRRPYRPNSLPTQPTRAEQYYQWLFNRHEKEHRCILLDIRPNLSWPNRLEHRDEWWEGLLLGSSMLHQLFLDSKPTGSPIIAWSTFFDRWNQLPWAFFAMAEWLNT